MESNTTNTYRRTGSPVESSNGLFEVGTSFFLGIGIDTYQHYQNLEKAKKDTEDLATLLLEKYDVQPNAVNTLLDSSATRQRIIQHLHDLRERLEPTDKLLIYFAGHGHIDHWKKGYWVPADGNVQDSSTLLSNSLLKDFLETIPARHILVISDSCYSGSLFYTGGKRGVIHSLEDRLEARRSRWALCSGHQDEKVMDEGPDGNSPFASAILRYLRDNKAQKCRVSSLAEYVLEVTGANYEQTAEGNPIYGVGHEGGQYIFRTKEVAKEVIDLSKEPQLPPYRATRGIGKVREKIKSDWEEVRRWLYNWGKAMGLLTLTLLILASLISSPEYKQFLIASIPILYLLVPLWPLRFAELSRGNLLRLIAIHGLIYYSFLLAWKFGSGPDYAWWQFALMIVVGLVGTLILIPLKSRK